MKYLFLDTETGGTDPVECDVLQIAWQLTDEDFFVIRKASSYLHAVRAISPSAAKVNGLTAGWLDQNAEEPAPVYRNLLQALLEANVLVGHYIPFDIGMLIEDAKRRLNATQEDRHLSGQVTDALKNIKTIDTKTDYVSLNPGWKKRAHPGPRLDELCRFLDIKTDMIRFHRADDDAEATRLCLKAIKYMYSDTIRG